MSGIRDIDPRIIIGIVIVVLIFVTGSHIAIINAINSLIHTAPVIHDAAKQICNIDSIVLEPLVSEVEKQNPTDPRIQNIIKMYKAGEKLTECDIVSLVHQLDETKRKQLNLMDLTCDVINCMG